MLVGGWVGGWVVDFFEIEPIRIEEGWWVGGWKRRTYGSSITFSKHSLIFFSSRPPRMSLCPLSVCL